MTIKMQTKNVQIAKVFGKHAGRLTQNTMNQIEVSFAWRRSSDEDVDILYTLLPILKRLPWSHPQFPRPDMSSPSSVKTNSSKPAQEIDSQ